IDSLFILLGLTDDPVLKIILFVIILCIHLVTISGASASIITLIRFSSELRHPMYLFLSNLAFADIGFSFSVTSNMLVNFPVEKKYNLLCCMWHSSGFNWIIWINHFFCDFAPLVELSCFDVSVPAVAPSFCVGAIIVFSGFVIAVSYIYSLIPILKRCSPEGRRKAFSTCTSHLTAVTLYFGTVFFIYVMPKFSYSTKQNKVVSVFYMVVIPVLNPLIYSLRNNEVKEALKSLLSRKTFF
uniref:G-protein coupled receptors family 1 profile domain-containing protein n=1 Tax=Cavia porcellus TaxID=10141 RepID=A0A286XKV3_CAVPO